jgi:hypothetical protein
MNESTEVRLTGTIALDPAGQSGRFAISKIDSPLERRGRRMN